MKKKSLTVLVVTALASSMLFSSCIGSFGLFNRLLDWNKNIDNTFRSFGGTPMSQGKISAKQLEILEYIRK